MLLSPKLSVPQSSTLNPNKAKLAWTLHRPFGEYHTHAHREIAACSTLQVHHGASFVAPRCDPANFVSAVAGVSAGRDIHEPEEEAGVLPQQDAGDCECQQWISIAVHVYVRVPVHVHVHIVLTGCLNAHGKEKERVE